jgi:hypothetical protein
VARKLYEASSTLKSFPNRGRIGRKKGTRELVIPSSPFIVIYRVTGTAVDIVRILHGGQKCPRRTDGIDLLISWREIERQPFNPAINLVLIARPVCHNGGTRTDVPSY